MVGRPEGREWSGDPPEGRVALPVDRKSLPEGRRHSRRVGRHSRKTRSGWEAIPEGQECLEAITKSRQAFVESQE